ncbi:hypothetical protein [Flavobacterium daejeonense]|uniref:hypothetical protein n=1 Tax=Flavobacterium daejeonense TaxID=350893 RepID=UPI00047BD0DD|nr:hypothetical protein [Flavobacterium daejeonense]
MLNYQKLMNLNPFVYEEFINSLGQKITFVEHPLKGDEERVICICHELKLASYSDFFETGDMIAEHREYEPLFIDGKFQHGK